ncbi:cytochrome P450 4C1-like isoform X1 [Vespula pensylvanica]|uniref:cytochrome P450 4C1-like isoform X1 n=1 Tax=Vespula pensylvanica TaxID=30213 RepID=UPI001CBA5114|nr:cytochrome P450 4C1-like isoform X1 [Vespula pensylvanica]
MEFIAIMIAITAILLGLFCGIANNFLNKLYIYNTIKGFPGPKAYPIIGNAHLFIGNTGDITNQILKISKNYQSIYRLWLGMQLFILINNSEYIKNVLKSPNITEKSEEYGILKLTVGNGLLTAPVSVWNTHRKFLNKVFLEKYLKSQTDVLVNHSIALIEKLETLIGEEVDIRHYVFRCTLDIVYDNMFNTRINSLINENCKLAESIDCLMDTAMQRILKLWLRPDIIFYNTAVGKKLRTCLSCLDNITSNIIKEKKESMLKSKLNRELTEENSEQKPSFLQNLLFESFHEDVKYSEQDIRDEINTIVIAGSDTTATTISFVLLMLATFPDIQNEVYKELNQIYGSCDPKDISIKYDDLKDMKLLERVIKETLRLFPAVPIIARKVTQDIEVTKNWTIPKGSSAIFFIYNLHRNEKYWPQPLIFDPDRFLPGRYSSSDFFPFSYGRRNCIGQNFAMLEMTIIIATLVRKFIIKIDKPVEIAEIGVKFCLSLKPTEPIRLKFEKRM